MSDTNPDAKRILLIDEDDDRRMTRVTLLQQAGYFVEVRRDIKSAQSVEDEGTFDLVIVALRLDPERTTAFSNELASHCPGLPILLLTDHGVFAPAGTLGITLEAGHPIELMSRLASMLAGSSYVRLIK
jgi:DNA-binding NtrC family response regulator